MNFKQRCIVETIVAIVLLSILLFFFKDSEFMPINVVIAIYAGACPGIIIANVIWYFLKRNEEV